MLRLAVSVVEIFTLNLNLTLALALILTWVSSCTLGAMIFSHTFCSASCDAKRAWCTLRETVVRKRIAVVVSKSWCGACRGVD